MYRGRTGIYRSRIPRNLVYCVRPACQHTLSANANEKGMPWHIPNPTLFQVLRILQLLIQIRQQLSVLEVVGLLQLNHSNTSNPSDVPVGLVILAIIVITQQDRSPCGTRIPRDPRSLLKQSISSLSSLAGLRDIVCDISLASLSERNLCCRNSGCTL